MTPLPYLPLVQRAYHEVKDMATFIKDFGPHFKIEVCGIYTKDLIEPSLFTTNILVTALCKLKADLNVQGDGGFTLDGIRFWMVDNEPELEDFPLVTFDDEVFDDDEFALDYDGSKMEESDLDAPIMPQAIRRVVVSVFTGPLKRTDLHLLGRIMNMVDKIMQGQHAQVTHQVILHVEKQKDLALFSRDAFLKTVEKYGCEVLVEDQPSRVVFHEVNFMALGDIFNAIVPWYLKLWFWLKNRLKLA